jgi:hypothetical protein
MLLTLCLGWAVLVRAADEVPPKSHPDSSGWEDMLAKDLSNAVAPAGVWKFDDGVLTATKDECVCVWTKTKYKDFVLDLEFKNDQGTNSGVIVHNSDLKNWIPNSVEIQIADDYAEKWAKAPKTWHCAAIFGHLAPSKDGVVKKPGEWNRMTVTCKGPMIYVLLNGEQVTVCDMTKWTSAKKNPDGSPIPPWLSKPMSELTLEGHIGLQGKHAGAPIYFRNVKIKTLE